MDNQASSVVPVSPFADMTILHPFMAVLLLVLCIVVMRARRDYVMIAFIVALNCIPVGQRVYVAGMNFSALRILIVVGLLRVVLRADAAGVRMTSIDRLVVLYAVSTTVAHYLQAPSLSTLFSSVGTSLDTVGAYAIVRLLVRDESDLRVVVRTFAILSFVLVALLYSEYRTGRNLFHVFGGAWEFAALRQGSFRATGPYPHSILAGAVWGAVLPLILGHRKHGGVRDTVLYLAVPCVAAIVVLSGSSTPLLSMAIGVLGMALYRQRDLLPALRITLAGALLGIALFWWHPVWFLFTKIDLTGSSGNYFRYLLIDNFVRNWRDWFLIGTLDTYRWGAGFSLAGLGLADWCNQFVAEGAGGGIVSLAAFVAMIVLAFRYVGALVSSAPDSETRVALWSLGASVLVHLFNFLGVSYFGQVLFSWWMILAFCSSLFQQRLYSFSRKARHAADCPGELGVQGGQVPD